MSDELPHESLEELHEQALCGYLVTRLDGTIVRANPTLLSWVGLEQDTLPSARRFQDLLTVPGRIFYETHYAPLLRLRGSVKEVAFDLARRGGEPLPVLVNSVVRTDGEGRPGLVASMLFDATERRAYERELLLSRRSAEQLAAIVTHSSDAIVGTSPTGTVLTWNAGAEALFGYAAQGVVGRNLREVLDPELDGTIWDELMAELRANRSIHREMVGRRADGRRVDVSVGLTPHPDPLGQLGAVSAIIRDIGDRRTAERLQRQFLAMATHELRTPVTSIKATAQLMRRRAAYSERALDAIVAQTDTLGRLIDDLLLATQIEADRLQLRPEETDLVAEAQAAAELLGADGPGVRVEAPPAPVVVSVDRQRLGQVLANLLTNAIKYAPDGGEIVVRVDRGVDEARVAVVDRGPGIPSDALPHLFDLFYRVPSASSRARGLGLGLFISRRIVEAHGGRIEVASKPGAGSTFTVVLPVPGSPAG